MRNMINRISYNPNIYSSGLNSNKLSFTGGIPTLTHTNIGNCLEGYIGKIRVRKGSDNSEVFLNVFKKYIGHNAENYSIKNDKGDLIGEADIFIKKYMPGTYDTFEYPTDPSHVYVDNLRNYSKPDTPYYKQGLEYMKDIGTRLLQIAQRRSDEAMCVGNVKLTAKGESKNWYKSIIGMVEEFPPIPSKFGINFRNPNILILPPHSKEPLSRLQGGL